jgi:hypothetical protein
VNITFSVCMFLVSVVQRNVHQSYYILLFVACLAVLYISISSHERYDFRKNVIKHEMCFDFINNFCLKHFSYQEELSETLINAHRTSYKVPVIFVRF